MTNQQDKNRFKPGNPRHPDKREPKDGRPEQRFPGRSEQEGPNGHRKIEDPDRPGRDQPDEDQQQNDDRT